jgi:thiol-disulfide isomerase/thioredoxin
MAKDSLDLLPAPYITMYEQDWCAHCDLECPIFEMVKDSIGILYCSTFCRQRALNLALFDENLFKEEDEN